MLKCLRLTITDRKFDNKRQREKGVVAEHKRDNPKQQYTGLPVQGVAPGREVYNTVGEIF